MLEKIKESKKAMMIKMEQANKIAESAAEEFICDIESLAKEASEEDLKNVINSKDEFLEPEDRLAFLAAFAENHKDMGGIILVGIEK